MKLRDYQVKLHDEIYAAWAAGHRNVLAVMPTGAGKCLGRGTPILMYDGTIKPVEDVRVGDMLMGPDSTPRGVISTCCGQEMLYRVTPVKGDPYVVNESHILSLKRTGDKRGEKGAVVNVEVRDYLLRTKGFKHVHKGWRAPVAAFGVETCDPPLPPYVLGVWLGDGNSRSPEICNVDHEVIAEWCAYAESIGHRIAISDEHKVPIYRIKGPADAAVGRGHRGNKVRSALTDMGLLLNKHIPHVYKTASWQQRLELLAGIVDTDGYLGNGHYDVVVKQEQFAKDIVFVARSLGLAAYIKPCEKQCTTAGAWGNYWRLSISGDIDKIPCRVARRKAQPRQQKKDVLVTGVSVEPIGVGDYFGFEVCGTDRLFMLGDFTVTHNTVTFAHVVSEQQGAVIVLAHRAELVAQISLALAREGVRHRVVGPKNLIKLCVQGHMGELRRSFYDATARVGVASVQSLGGYKDHDGWLHQVQLWVHDEAHHLLADNQFGKAVARLPNARGLGVTATPSRTDGKGLGRRSHGLMDTMILGPQPRELIRRGFLSRYKIFAPPNDFHREEVKITASGEFNPQALKEATKKSRVLGDVVDHYVKHASGKLGLTFADSIENATDIARRYRAAGVAAEVLTGDTDDFVRAQVLQRFRNRQVMQIVSVALIDEGFDCPGVEVVSDAAATESLGRYLQRFGRGLRVMEGKTHMLYFDHVGNVQRHGLPDKERAWSLDPRERRGSKKSGDDTIPQRTCVECAGVYERILTVCPYCGAVHEPAGRSSPEQVDGDLQELDTAALEALWGEVARVDGPCYPPQHLDAIARRAVQNRHHERQVAQKALREVMDLWAGWKGQDLSACYKLFYWKYGMDVATAMALGAREAEELRQRICDELDENGVVRV